MRDKIAVIGDKDSILAFQTVGFEVFETYNDAQTEEILVRIAKDDYAIIYITETEMQGVSDVVDRYKEKMLPAIIAIPSFKGSKGLGIENVRKSVERAVGADILFNK